MSKAATVASRDCQRATNCEHWDDDDGDDVQPCEVNIAPIEAGRRRSRAGAEVRPNRQDLEARKGGVRAAARTEGSRTDWPALIHTWVWPPEKPLRLRPWAKPESLCIAHGCNGT